MRDAASEGRETSRTAFGTAYMRAAHMVLDAPPRILDDTAIVSLLGKEGMARITGAPDAFQAPVRRALRAHVVFRSRYAEDRLQAAVGRSVSQCVVLGAGLDTFALRQPEWARSLRIVEVDHAGTQRVKLGLIKAAGMEIPANVTFAAVDFEHETLHEGLIRHGVSFTAPTFFSWLGVTMYLREPAIDAVLRTIAEFPKGSEVVLTFARADLPASPFQGKSAEIGEPWLSHFTLASMEAKLKSCGLVEVEFPTPEFVEERYFRDNGGNLEPPKATTIVAGMV